MSIKVYCSSCKAGFTASEKHAGKKTKCPMCGRQIEIPALPSSTDSASHNPSENQSGLATKASALENEKQNHTWSVTNPTVVFGVVCVSVTAVVVFALIWNLRTPHSGEVDSPPVVVPDTVGQPPSAIPAAAISPIARDAQKVLKQHCYKCHGENGVATSGLNVLKWKQLTGPNGPVVSEAPDDSNLFEYMVSGDMPPEDDDRVKVRPTAEEIAIIRTWILAGAPNFEELIKREFISPEQMLEFMQSDLRDKIAQRDRRYIRYFTLTHLYNAGVRDDDIQTYRLGLSKLVNSLSWNRNIVVPKPIDPNKTIFRIDLRDYDWDVQSSDATVTVWDMIIAQCPYNVEQSYPAASYCSRQTGHKIPYVRGDWFVAAASRPPIYHQILDIPRTDKELETRLGVNVAANIGRERVDRAGFTNSGVSDNNRLIERHQSRYGAYWKSYDFAGNKGRQLLTRHPLGPGDNKTFFKHDGGEIIFNLPNGLQAYMLVKADGQRIDKGPTNIVKDPDDTARDGGAVVNGISCMHCHDQGMKRKDDEIRPYALANPVVFRNQPGLADFIKALYPVKGAMDRLFDEDAKMHILAAEKSGSPVIEDPDTGKPKLVDAQPVVRLATQFHNELDLELAAAEAGIRPDRLTKLIDQSKILAEQIGLLKIPGKTIKRDTYDAAVAEIIRGLGTGIYRYSIHVDKAINYYQLALYDKAIVESTKAIELDPTSTMAYFLRGSAYGEEGEYDKAIIDYAEAIRVDPNYAVAYNNRGNAYKKQGNKAKAEADFAKAEEPSGPISVFFS